ncbi:hypothetical protein TNCV_111591 [Trichonephila clavipes]|nr:hypothetical protein TNCV_111591 [Trichonephila clavipes]
MYHVQFPDGRTLDHRVLQRCAHLPDCHIWVAMDWPWWIRLLNATTSQFIKPRSLFMGSSDCFLWGHATSWLRWGSRCSNIQRREVLTKETSLHQSPFVSGRDLPFILRTGKDCFLVVSLPVEKDEDDWRGDL